MVIHSGHSESINLYNLWYMFTRREASFVKYWKRFMVPSNSVHAFGYNSTGSEQIWMKFGALGEHCLELAHFWRDPHRSESEPKFCFLSNK